MCILHMQPSQDLVVRLTAAAALQAAVTDFAFYPDAFSSYLEPSLHQLYSLLNEVEECESKIKILEVIVAIIDGSGKYVS